MRRVAIVASILWMTIAAEAQTQVATVTSSAPFKLRAADVTPGAGVPTWPVLAGDHVVAGVALTIVTFMDGSVAALAPQSEAKVDFLNGKPTFQLLSGTARYSLKSKTAVVMLNANNKVVAVVALTGTLAIGTAAAVAAGFWTAGTIAAVVVAGGAATAGLAVGISHFVTGGAAVSPSQ